MKLNAPEYVRLSRESATRQASAWWGMWALIATEASLFAYLLFSYAYLAALNSTHWPHEKPALVLPLTSTSLLLASSGVYWQAERALRSGKRRRGTSLLALTLLLGCIFTALQGYEWHNRHYTVADGTFASSYFVTTGFHMAHVIVGLLMIACLMLLLSRENSRTQWHVRTGVVGMYWHFVDAVWVAVFCAYYVWPYLRS